MDECEITGSKQPAGGMTAGSCRGPLWRVGLFIAIWCVLGCSNDKKSTAMNMTDNTVREFSPDTSPHFASVNEELRNIFELRLPHAVATNDWDNAITLLSFENGQLVRNPVAADFLNEVSGGNISPAPPFSDEWIGYGQTRGFVRFNLKTRTFMDQNVCAGFEETILASRALDPAKGLFAFMIQYLTEDDVYGRAIYRVADLSRTEPKVLASLERGRPYLGDKGGNFVVKDGVIFAYDRETQELLSLDARLKPVKHIISTAFNQYKKELEGMGGLSIHPRLPCATVGGKDFGLLTWKDDKPELKPFPFASPDVFVGNFRFSHDGRYLAWSSWPQGQGERDVLTFWVAPVSDAFPGYIGPARRLGTVPDEGFEPLATAWAENPAIYVVSEFSGLYWWHIEQEKAGQGETR